MHAGIDAVDVPDPRAPGRQLASGGVPGPRGGVVRTRLSRVVTSQVLSDRFAAANRPESAAFGVQCGLAGYSSDGAVVCTRRLRTPA